MQPHILITIWHNLQIGFRDEPSFLNHPLRGSLSLPQPHRRALVSDARSPLTTYTQQLFIRWSADVLSQRLIIISGQDLRNRLSCARWQITPHSEDYIRVQIKSNANLAIPANRRVSRTWTMPSRDDGCHHATKRGITRRFYHGTKSWAITRELLWLNGPHDLAFLSVRFFPPLSERVIHLLACCADNEIHESLAL